MSAAAYLRSSTAEQDLEHQRQAAQRWATAHQITLDMHEEPGVSGVAASRPVLEAIVRDARAGRVKTLWVYELSRLGRSMVAVVTLLSELHALGVRVVVQSGNIDFSTPMGRFQGSLFALLAELERDILRERTQSGMDALRDANGKCTLTKSGMPAGRPGWVWTDETGLNAIEAWTRMRAMGSSWPEVHAAGIEVFRWTMGKDGRGGQVAAVPSMRAIQRAMGMQ